MHFLHVEYDKMDLLDFLSILIIAALHIKASLSTSYQIKNDDFRLTLGAFFALHIWPRSTRQNNAQK